MLDVSVKGFEYLLDHINVGDQTWGFTDGGRGDRASPRIAGKNRTISTQKMTFKARKHGEALRANGALCSRRW